MTCQSNFLKQITTRGFLHQCTDQAALDTTLVRHEKEDKPLIAYIGFDCTAPSLHVGSLIQIMILRHFQQCGHKPIVLMGGGTTKVGDPSGKDQSRQMLDGKTIEQNKQNLRRVFTQFLRFEEQFNPDSSDALMVDNADWLDNLNYIAFLRDYGRFLSVNEMLTRESVRLRLERQQHLSFLEFNYMVLQAYDFVELSQRFGCHLQIGGSDQWGNILSGVQLYEKHCSFHEQEKAALYGLTTPLLTTASGAKMGKTADGAIWLDGEMLSAYDYWQFWRNVEDADTGRFLRLFTELSMDRIAELEALQDAKINEAKKILATEATALLHGREQAEQAEETALQTFEQGKTASTLPEIVISPEEAAEAIPAFKLFQIAGLANSGKEARRLIQGGGARIDDVQITDENQLVNIIGTVKLSAGKKRHILLRLSA